MKGYFSQLARRTGISFETGRASRSAHGAQFVGPAETIDSQPLHVDEVTFTDEPTPAADLVSPHVDKGSIAEGRTGPVGPPRDESPRLTANEASESKIRQTQVEPQGPAPQFDERHSRGTFAEATPSSLAAESIQTDLEDRLWERPTEAVWRSEVVILEGSVHGGRSGELVTPTPGDVPFRTDKNDPTGALEPPPDPLEFQAVSRERPPAAGEGGRKESKVPSKETPSSGYQLKEVIDWIAEPWEPGAEEIDPATYMHGKARAIPEGRQETRPAFQMREDQQHEVQALSLSIGTISLVIEEPQKEQVQSKAVPARTERVAEQPAQSDLSRYYIRGW